MKYVNKKVRVGATMFFIAAGAELLSASAYAADCPSADFNTFVTNFSTTIEAQKKSTAGKVNTLVLRSATKTDEVEPKTSTIARSNLTFPLMAPILSSKTQGIEIEEIDAAHATLVDRRAGSNHIKVFSFAHKTCWVLEGIEDWSISDKALSPLRHSDMSSVESACLQRAEVYARLGSEDRYRLSNQLFEAALENYLCAASSGNPRASLDAASLSLSGMAPRLEDTQIEALLKTAATTLADGAAALSTFYCYGNTGSANGLCRHPELAEQSLVRAAAMGSIDAINYLGFTFETGELLVEDQHRAIACYRLAAEKGSQMAAANLKRMETQASETPVDSFCY